MSVVTGIGKKVGHYEIISKIGVGGMGEVYLAHDTSLDRKVAIKSLGEEFKNDEARLNRFITEARATSALNHPNILTIFEITRKDDTNLIVSEYVDGITLKQLLKREHPTLRAALDIAIHVASALHAAHRVGIVHRDIKPANIMIRNDGIVKVVDFGIAKVVQASFDPSAHAETPTIAMGSTEPGMMVGTPRYMSPEQARGQDVDGRSDIFSFGIVMYELFSGKRPFEGEEPVDLISSILKDEPPLLRRIDPTLPREIERIVEKSLRKNRDQRYQSVKDLLIDLEDVRDDLKFEARMGQSSDDITNRTIDVTQEDPDRLTDIEPARSTVELSPQAAPEQKSSLALWVTAAAFLLVSVVAAVWIYRSSEKNTVIAGPAVAKEVASWASSPGELFSNASFSPDGKLIAFSSTRSGTRNIWVTQSGSTEAVKVTGDTLLNRDPVWSPKGDEIAFISERGSAAEGSKPSTGIWRISALGGTSRAIAPLTDASAELRRWAASGNVYFQFEGELWAAEIARGDIRTITSFKDKYGSVRWVDISDDEKEIAFLAVSGNTWRLYTGKIEGAEPTLVLETNDEIGGVAWDASNDKFYYSAMNGGVFQIFSTKAGGPAPSRMTASDTDNVVLDVAADGKAVLFSSAKEDLNLWRVEVAGGKEAPVARSLTSELWPDVSPEGAKIAFQSVKNLSRGNGLFEGMIAVKSSDVSGTDSEPSIISDKGGLPAWSPDGSSVAFLRELTGTMEIWVANPSGGGERRLTGGGISKPGYSVSPYNHIQANAFAWSPDGSGIAYVSQRSGAANLWLVSGDGSSDVQLTDNQDTDVLMYAPDWNSDGRRLAYYVHSTIPGPRNAELRIFDRESRSSRSILTTGQVMRMLGWSADGSSILFAGTDRLLSLPPETVIRSVNAETGAQSPVIRLENAYFYNIVISPDGKRIAYVARNENLDDIWHLPSGGGTPKKLTGNNDSGLYFSKLAWYPDGSAIVFGKQSRFSLLSMLTDMER